MRLLDDRPAVRQFKARVYTGITRRFDSVTLRIMFGCGIEISWTVSIENKRYR